MTRNDACVVITTIHPPTPAILGYIGVPSVGVIVESDDANIPRADWASASLRRQEVPGSIHFVVGGSRSVNPYRLFTERHVWPRGLPLCRVLHDDARERTTPVESAGFFSDVSIIQGLADGDPDVDAIFRLTSPESLRPLTFAQTGAYYTLAPTACAPANTQNTVWRDRRDFPLLSLPGFVSFRFCDILKMSIAQAFARREGRSLAFQGATVFQDRNPHDRFADYLEACEMYRHVDRLIALLEETVDSRANPPGPCGLQALYGRLAAEGIVADAREPPLLRAWCDALGG